MVQEQNVSPSSPTQDDPVLTAVHRALGEMQGQRPLAIAGEDGLRLVLLTEGLDDARLAAFVGNTCTGEAEFALTAVRGRVMGLEKARETGALVTRIAAPGAGGPDAQRLHALATALGLGDLPAFEPGNRTVEAALQLAKLAQRIPACLISPPLPDVSIDTGTLVVSTDDIAAFPARLAATLKPVSEARVPIIDGIGSRFVIFRNAIGGIATAVIVGEPKTDAPVPVRVHSSCLTGDIFGSRRCDCGEQLQLALHRLDELGGGCLIYLDQEGRGLGLANKMHAYTLQDQGLDTVDANMALGFHDDERDYHAAGFMLKSLGWERITLLTNNPTKLTGLAAANIEVAERLPVVTRANADNRRYLETKARRAGHLLDTAGLLETV